MVRMSDILKKAKGIKGEEEAKPAQPQKPAPREDIPEGPKKKAAPPPKPSAFKKAIPIKEKTEEEAPKLSEVSISSIVRKESRAASGDESVKLYEEAVSLMEELLANLNPNTIDPEKIAAVIEKIVNQLNRNHKKLIILTFNEHSTCLPRHLVNVCIYAVEIGVGLDYDKARLTELGMSAILHDIGMKKYMNLARQPRKLDAKECEEIKTHPAAGAQILANITGLSKVIAQAVYQEHERVNGKGYPKGLKDKAISEYARIIGLVDVYSAMTHPRPYRNNDCISPLKTVQEILKQKDVFDHKITKIFLERLGFFPAGSFIELNTKEVCHVVKTNDRYPMRPVVKVLYDSDGNSITEEKTIDLAAQYNIYITRGECSKKKLTKNIKVS